MISTCSCYALSDGLSGFGGHLPAVAHLVGGGLGLCGDGVGVSRGLTEGQYLVVHGVEEEREALFRVVLPVRHVRVQLGQVRVHLRRLVGHTLLVLKALLHLCSRIKEILNLFSPF